VKSSAPWSIPPALPGSTALREFRYADEGALSVPNVAERPGMRLLDHAEDAFLRVYRDRTGLVLSTMRWVLASREIDDRDVMIFAVSLREQVTSHADESDDRR
jgi:hypothetical protein